MKPDDEEGDEDEDKLADDEYVQKIRRVIKRSGIKLRRRAEHKAEQKYDGTPRELLMINGNDGPAIAPSRIYPRGITERLSVSLNLPLSCSGRRAPKDRKNKGHR